MSNPRELQGLVQDAARRLHERRVSVAVLGGRAAGPELADQFLPRPLRQGLVVVDPLHEGDPVPLPLVYPVLAGRRPAAFGDEVAGKRLAVEQVFELPAR